MKNCARVCRGNTLTEYGMLLGLVAVASAAALQMLGGADSNLLSTIPKSQGPLLKMVNMDFSGASGLQAGPVKLQGAGYYTLKVNPRTGMPKMTLTDNGSGSVTNATSIDGSEWNILGQFHLADSLMKLADEQTDPDNASYIRQLANISYYMGGAEGEIDGVKGLEILGDGGDPYGKLNGYTDLQRLQKQMQTLLGSAPSSLDRQTLAQVFGLSTDVYNIGQSYVSALAPVAGQSAYGFSMPSDLNGAETGTPGQALTVSSSSITLCTNTDCGTPPSMGGPTIEQMLSISTIQQKAQVLLSDNKVDSQPVEATLTDATHLDKTATTVQAASSW